MSAQHVAFYGKGGVGTSTTATNISVALAEAGQRVIQVGFDPERDSTGFLRGDRKIRTILDVVQKSQLMGGFWPTSPRPRPAPSARRSIRHGCRCSSNTSPRS